MPYQTHASGPAGDSDSPEKLSRLNLPTDLTGKRVLDIGCNEGYFCAVAAERGAQVVGIDRWSSAIAFAKERYGHLGMDFICRGWDQLPPGPFDIVIWASAMHYEPDPRRQMERIRDVLAPDGMLILECGVLEYPSREMVRVQRGPDFVWHPTRPFLLEHLLSGFAVRTVHGGNRMPGDPVPRAVFHCHVWRPVVMIVRAPSQSGKGALAARLSPQATKVVSVDTVVLRVAAADRPESPIHAFIKKHGHWQRLNILYQMIDQEGLTTDFAGLLATHVVPSDELVLYEGDLSEPQARALADALRPRARVWEATRLA